VTVIINSLFPVLALIVTGFIIQRSNFLPSTFWPSAERLTYFLLMPAILIHSLANKKMDSLPWLNVLLTVEGTVIVSAALVTIWWLLNRKISGETFTSLFQGGVRFNSFVAFALAENLYGRDGLLIAALAAGFMIILINILCVAAFSLTVHKGPINMKRVFGDLIKNPLIIACVIGVGLNVTGLKIPSAIDGVLLLGGKAAFPIGLMAVGAAYRGGNLLLHKHPLIVTSIIQFLCKPLVAGGLATSLGLSGSVAGVLVLMFCVPTAPAGYILAKQMGGDHEVMTSIITTQTCLSFLTMPLTIWLFS